MNFNVIKYVLGVYAVFLSSPSFGDKKIRVITTIPELAWVAQEVGGDAVEARALLKGTENPHHVDAVPEFIRLVADADIVCIVGLGLEVGYMPPVFARSGNSKVQPGGPGYCEAGQGISPLEKPAGAIDRSMGDVHPEGNPHFWLSPKFLAESAREVAQSLSRSAPSKESHFKKGLKAFEDKMQRLSDRLVAILKPSLNKARGKATVMEYHKEFTYFFAQFGLSSWGSIEEKPGVPPSAGRIAQVAETSRNAGVKVAFAADYNPESVLGKFHELSKIPVLKFQTMIRPGRGIGSYEDLQGTMAESLAKALAGEAR